MSDLLPRPDPFPYYSNFLNWVSVRENLNAETIFALTEAIQEWLSENVKVNGVNNYEWSYKTKMINGAHGTVAFPEKIYFAYEEDLVAFRLRWGIQG